MSFPKLGMGSASSLCDQPIFVPNAPFSCASPSTASGGSAETGDATESALNCTTELDGNSWEVFAKGADAVCGTESITAAFARLGCDPPASTTSKLVSSLTDCVQQPAFEALAGLQSL